MTYKAVNAGSNGEARLAPHPWDALGAPPPLGTTYPGVMLAESGVDVPADIIAAAKRAAGLLRSAEESREEAEALERDARDCERDAEKLLATMREAYPSLVSAIEDDPYAIDDDDVIDAAKPGHDEARA